MELDSAQVVNKRCWKWVRHIERTDQTRWLRKRFNAIQKVEEKWKIPD
jgi:hypothetical protein